MRSFIALLVVAASVRAAEPAVTALALAPDGATVLLGSQKGLQRRSWSDLKLGEAGPCKLTHIHDLAFSPDGKQLLIAGGTPGEIGEVEVLSWPDAKLLRRVIAGDDVIQSVAWRADSKQWACASLDGECRVFETEKDKPTVTFKGHSRSVLSLMYLPGGEHILSTGIDQSLRVWEATTGKTLRTLDNHTQPVTGLALRPGQDKDALPMIASGGLDRTVRLWQPTIGRMMRFVRLPSPVLTVAWTHDGKHIVAGCRDGKIRIIDPDSLDIVCTEIAFDGWIHSLLMTKDSILSGGANGQCKRLKLPEKPRTD